MKNRRIWTPEEELVLVEHVKNGVSDKAIAELMNINLNHVRAKIKNLRKKGVDLPYRQLTWTKELDKEVIDTVAKNEGNLRAAFRIVAENHNVNYTCVSTRWYTVLRHRNVVFSTFGRYRGAKNRKIYNKKDSKGYTFWTMIKRLFN